MALLNFNQVSLEWWDGKAEKAALYSLKNVTAGDTVNLNGAFLFVKRAVAASATDVHTGVIANINGTIITIPPGPLNDAIWLFVVGVSA